MAADSSYLESRTSLALVKGAERVATLLDGPEIQVFTEVARDKYLRSHIDGIATFTGKVAGSDVAFVVTDYKFFGGSFSCENSRRLGAFLALVHREHRPLVVLLRTIGLRAFEGRKIFSAAFSTLADFKRLNDRNLLITIAEDTCLGFGGPVFATGDYRLATSDCRLNLTGPQIIKMFFGDKINFEEMCSAQRIFKLNHLIHHLCPNLTAAFATVKLLLKPTLAVAAGEIRDQATLARYLEERVTPLFPGFSKSLKVGLLGTAHGVVGLLYNMPSRPNLTAHRDVKLARLALRLFKKLGVPVLSLVDSPGGDPRVEQNDTDLFEEIYGLCGDIIDYPWPKRGIVYGRCYGGASVMTLPAFYGGLPGLVVDCAKMGVMGGQLIEQIFQGTPTALRLWNKQKAAETSDFHDLKSIDVIGGVIAYADLPQVFAEHARASGRPRRARSQESYRDTGQNEEVER